MLKAKKFNPLFLTKGMLIQLLKWWIILMKKSIHKCRNSEQRELYSSICSKTKIFWYLIIELITNISMETKTAIKKSIFLSMNHFFFFFFFFFDILINGFEGSWEWGQTVFALASIYSSYGGTNPLKKLFRGV